MIKWAAPIYADNNRRRGHMAFAAVVLAMLLSVAAMAQAAPKPLAERVEASVLVASPGDKIYQSTGHAALRLRCEAFGLDNVFSFETDTDTDLPQLLGHAKGRFGRIAFAEYVDEFARQGRGVVEYPLNLTDPQIRNLWRIMDQEVARGYEEDFNLRFRSCSSMLLSKLSEAVAPGRLILRSDDFDNNSNGRLLKNAMDSEQPWAVTAICASAGSGADGHDPWPMRLVPLLMDKYLGRIYLAESAGAQAVPIVGAPVVIVENVRNGSGWLPTPILAAVIVLLISAMVSVAEVRGCCRMTVKIADYLLLASQTAMAVVVLLLTVVPSGICTGWNWMFIPFNLLPAIALALRRKKPLCRRLLAVYAAACALFIAAPLLTEQAGLWSSLLSAAIVLRIFTHLKYIK